MPKVSLLEDSPEELSYCFYCPGCRCSHFFRIRTGRFTRNDPDRPGNIPLWTWNGDFERPTVNPSIDVNSKDPKSRCHSFVVDGFIRYQGDSYHQFKGQVIPMEEDD
jgi:hypothetical protein